MKNSNNVKSVLPTNSLSENELLEKEQALKLREENIRQKEIELAAHEVEHFKAMAALKEEKLNYQALVNELHQQKTVLIQICKDIDFEYN